MVLKINKSLILGVSLVSLLQSTQSGYAHINAFSHEDIDGSQLGMSFIVLTNKNPVIQEASHAALASYNDKDLVAKKMRPLREQVGFKARDELKKDHNVIEFNATDSLHGIVPAGIITYRENTIGKAQIMIAFHGTESVEDFTEANLLLYKIKGTALGIEGKIHGGFYERYMQSRPAMMNGIQKQLADHEKDIQDVEFIITGHSLGGALATIAAADVKKNIAQLAAPVDLVTFASPRVVNAQGAKYIETLLGAGRAIRIWRDKDPITRILLGIFGYKHVGQSVKLKSATNYVNLKNHSLSSIRAEALKSEDVEIQEHEGYRSWMVRKILNAPKAALNIMTGSWFSGKKSNTPTVASAA